jgi:small subunit ribosomal protein S6
MIHENEWCLSNMKLYENIFIGRQDLSQQQVEALGANLALFITQNNGEVARSEYCGFRTLAYPIKKNYKGHYYVIHMKVPIETSHELSRTMKLNEDIIRYSIVKVDEFDDRENLILQAKLFGDDSEGNADRGYRARRSASAEGSDEVIQAEKTVVEEQQ